MKEFGWSVEYTLQLSFPIFLGLTSMITRVRSDSAIDEFYTPYVAAKVGRKCSKALFDSRGSVFRIGSAVEAPEYTPEMVERACRKLQELIEKRAKEAEKARSIPPKSKQKQRKMRKSRKIT